MRTKIFCLLSVMGYSMLMAEPVSVTEAQQKAFLFLSEKTADSGQNKRRAPMKSRDLTLVHQSPIGTEQSAYYVFNVQENGFVIVAGDDRATDILGYSDKGSFDADHIPEGLQDLLEGYKKQIEYVATQNKSKASRRARADWENITPMIMTTWDQGSPYNALCPIDPDDGRRCVTGCTATALAQIMYYHQWPMVGRGKIAYEWVGGKILSADFSQVRFEWNKMKLAYDDDTDPNQAVATLMYHVALATRASFASDGTYGSYSAGLLHQFFCYKKANFLMATTTTLENLIYQNLQKKLPVIFSATEPSSDSHVMVIDGYGGDGYFHINLGWSGDQDGFYQLNAIDVDYYNFTINQAIVYNIEPDYSIPQTAGLYPSTSYSLSYDDGNLIQWMGEETEIDMAADANFWDVQKINKNAFTDKSELRFLNLPTNTYEIESNAFLNCTGLESVCFPSTLTLIGAGAFTGCTNLKNFIFNEENSTFASEKGMLFNSKEKSLLAYAEGAGADVTIPEGIASIGSSAFEGTGITSVKIPSSLKSLGSRAFYGCEHLSILTLPAALWSISTEAFAQCTGLKQLNVLSTTPPSVNSNTFDGLDLANIHLCVPQESLQQYRNADVWKRFKTIVGVAKPEAKKLVVFLTDGSMAEFKLRQLPFIKNGDTSIEIQSDGTTISFDHTKLQKMLFVNENTDVKTDILSVEASEKEGPREVINFSQLPPYSKIEIYDVEGKLLRKERVGSTSQALSLTDLGTGVFLVRVNGITYKIYRR